MSENYIYSNIYFYNGSNQAIPISYNEVRTTPVVDRGSDYELSIIRYSVPIQAMPLFIYDPDKYSIGQTNDPMVPLDDYLTYDGRESNYPTSDIRAKYVMNPQVWVNYLNYKMKEAVFVGYVQLTIIQDRLVIIVDDSHVTYHTSPATNFIKMNAALYSHFFSGFPAEFDSTTGLYTLIINFSASDFEYNPIYGNPDVRATPVNQELFNFRDTHNSLASWGTIRRVVFLTNNIQIRNETISSKIIHPITGKLDNSGNLTILTDFEIPYNNLPLQKDYLFYQPQLYRYMSITKSGPIDRLDINVYFEDPESATFYPLFMNPTTDVSVKLMFRKRKELRKI